MPVHEMQSRFRCLSVLAAGLLGAAGAEAAVTVTVTPAAASLAPLHQQVFTAQVSGSTDASVGWMVNGVLGGAPATGYISSSGTYTAPADVPAASKVEIEAQSVASNLVYGTAAASLTASAPATLHFYVSTSGSDTNAGTSAAPWRTIQHAVSTVPAGAAIEVASGAYNELVTITRGGSAAAGFTALGAAPGAAPVIDGTGLAIPNGENGLITIQDVSFVRVSGFEIRNYVSHSAALDPVGILVQGSGSHIELLSNHVHNITTTVQTSAGDALGIAVYGTEAPASLNDILIDGNQLDDLTTGFSESLALSGNVVNWQVTDNSIHDNDNIGIDVGGYEQVSPQTAYDMARHGYVAANTVYNITSLHNPAYDGQQSADGIYVDGGTGVVIERNLVHNTDLGIEIASEHHDRTSNTVAVRSNVIYRSNVVGVSIGGYANGVGGTSNTIFVNNTLFDNDTTQSGTGEIQVQYHASNNAFRNNIAYANAQGLLLYAFVPTTPVPATFAKDLYFSGLGAGDSQWVWQNKTYTGFTNYMTGTGNDAGGSFANPLFQNVGANNYQLATGSPAIGVGVLLPLSWRGLYDCSGNPRVAAGKTDLGAYQN